MKSWSTHIPNIKVTIIKTLGGRMLVCSVDNLRNDFEQVFYYAQHVNIVGHWSVYECVPHVCVQLFFVFCSLFSS